MTHTEFQALAQGKCDYTLKVIPVANDGETLMTVLATEEAVYISKAQVMAFFGLVEPTATPVAPAEPVAWRRVGWGTEKWFHTDEKPTEELAWEPLYAAPGAAK